MIKKNEVYGSGCCVWLVYVGFCFMVVVVCFVVLGVLFVQDGVMLYGVIDEFVQVVNMGNGYMVVIDLGGQWGSWFGLKGGEDIGGGQKIEFVLENGFNLNDGLFVSVGMMFNWQVWVGIVGQWGKMCVGWQNLLLFNDQGGQDVFGGVMQVFGMDNLIVFVFCMSNMLLYQSLEIVGFQGGLYVGFGDVGGVCLVGFSWQFDLIYEYGLFGVFVVGQWLKNVVVIMIDCMIMVGVLYVIGKVIVYGGFFVVKWVDFGIDLCVYGVLVKYQFNFVNIIVFGYVYLYDQLL